MGSLLPSIDQGNLGIGEAGGRDSDWPSSRCRPGLACRAQRVGESSGPEAAPSLSVPFPGPLSCPLASRAAARQRCRGCCCPVAVGRQSQAFGPTSQRLERLRLGVVVGLGTFTMLGNLNPANWLQWNLKARGSRIIVF